MLLRLKLGLERHLPNSFVITVSTVSRVYITWVRFLAATFSGSLLRLKSRQEINAHTPKSVSKYPGTRVIIDCTDFFFLRNHHLQVHKRLLGVIISISGLRKTACGDKPCQVLLRLFLNCDKAAEVIVVLLKKVACLNRRGRTCHGRPRFYDKGSVNQEGSEAQHTSFH